MLATSIQKWLGLDNLPAKLWEQVEPWVDRKVDELVDKYLPVVIEKILGMFPTFTAGAAKVVIEKMFDLAPGLPNVTLPEVPELAGEVIDKVVDGDPDFPIISDIVDVSEMIRKWREGRR